MTSSKTSRRRGITKRAIQKALSEAAFDPKLPPMNLIVENADGKYLAKRAIEFIRDYDTFDNVKALEKAISLLGLAMVKHGTKET